MSTNPKKTKKAMKAAVKGAMEASSERVSASYNGALAKKVKEETKARYQELSKNRR